MEFKEDRVNRVRVSTTFPSAQIQGNTPLEQDEESVLFSAPIPVRVKNEIHEEKLRILSFHIDLVSELPQNHKVLRIQITEEADPFFLFTLNVSEADFHGLKHEQNLLVDFSAFPSKFIELLELCSSSKDSPVPKFLAVLSSRNGHSQLNIMETNQFKHLQHLSLQFRPGNDSSIKKYLARRVLKFKAQNEHLSSELQKTQNSLATHSNELDDLRNRYSQLETINSRLVDKMQNEHICEINTLKEKMLATQQQLQTTFDSDKRHSVNESQQKISELERKRDGCMKKIQNATEERLLQENRIRELSSSLESHKKELSSCKAELERISEECRNIEKMKFEQEKTIHKHLLRLSALEQHLIDKEEVASKMAALLESAKEQKEALQSSVNMYKRSCESNEKKLRDCSREIVKGNQIIGHLQKELRSSRNKIKMKSSALEQRETNMQQCQKKINETELVLTDSTKQLETKAKECENLERTLNQTKEKLEESQKLLESNQQVISWLNKQINEAELSKTTHIVGSRFASSSYRYQPTVGTDAPSNPPPKHGSSSHTPAYASTWKFSGRGAFAGQSAGHQPPSSLALDSSKPPIGASADRRAPVTFTSSYKSHPISSSSWNSASYKVDSQRPKSSSYPLAKPKAPETTPSSYFRSPSLPQSSLPHLLKENSSSAGPQNFSLAPSLPAQNKFPPAQLPQRPSSRPVLAEKNVAAHPRDQPET
uniref:ER-Golgi vesicle-tethering protein/Myosin class II heavy chain n=1 Tax=Hirondellea gigas TaxID=1518452 RepID=A0A6A7G1S8_9CRUS